MTTPHYTFSNLKQVKEVAHNFLADYPDARVIALYGAMGVGKTTLIKELCAVLGVIDTVNSPSFSLVNEYLTNTNLTVYHFDFYRIDSIEEALDMGCEDYFYSGNYCFIEWPERIEELLPPETLKINIVQNEGEQRKVFID